MFVQKKTAVCLMDYMVSTLNFIVVACFILILSGCPSPKLEPVSMVSKLDATGDFNPENPSMVNFPVKVIFAIDDSGSMGSTDPQDLRIDAVKQFVNEYLTPDHENAWVNVYLWGSGIEEGTGAFTQTKEEIETVLDAANSGSGTDYMKSLTEMYSQIQSDILKDIQENARSTRSKYIGIFLSDGSPGDGSGTAAYIQKIQEIATMVKDNGSSTFILNTYLLANGLSGQPRTNAETLLTDMALAGEGEFTVLESAEDIDFVNTIDMSVSIQYRLKYFFACNYNARPGTDEIFTDSDSDGLNDEDEAFFGTDPQLKDTDNDGYSDYFEIVRSTEDNEYDPLVPDIPCEFVVNGRYTDTDRDGLTDCEETYLTTKLDDIDTDQDFIPDDIEFIFGTNPLEPEEFNDDDQDGMDNLRELQLHTNPSSDDPLIHERHKYKYVLNKENEENPLSRAYSFDVSNIKIVNTQGSFWDKSKKYNLLDPGENRVRFYYCQLPEDSTNLDDLIYRMAEVKVKYGSEEYENFSQFDFMVIQGAE